MQYLGPFLIVRIRILPLLRPLCDLGYDEVWLEGAVGTEVYCAGHSEVPPNQIFSVGD